MASLVVPSSSTFTAARPGATGADVVGVGGLHAREKADADRVAVLEDAGGVDVPVAVESIDQITQCVGIAHLLDGEDVRADRVDDARQPVQLGVIHRVGPWARSPR